MNKTLIVIFVGAVIALLALSIFQEDLLKESMESPTNPQYNSYEGWRTDYQESINKAKENNRNLLILFTGSDWCPPCKMMLKNVWSKESFKTFAKKNLELLVLDFPQGKKLSEAQSTQNQKLAGQYNVSTYPLVLILNPEGVEISRMNFHGELAEGFIERYQEVIKKK